MNNEFNIYELQKLLYIWLSRYESRSIDSIKIACNNLVNSYEVTLSNPIWNIFWPLVFNGVVDHIGKGNYALTEPLIVDCNKHYYSINCNPNDDFIETEFVGIRHSLLLPKFAGVKIVKNDAISILKKFPSIDKIVDSFPKTLQEESELEYYNWKTKKGIAKLAKDGVARYFSIPDKLYIRKVPDKNINPDAFAITYCYSRAINDELNGIYKKDEKKLYVPSFAFPLTIYRVLLIETMKEGIFPKIRTNKYVFCGITNNVINELNRIFCNTISYE